MQLLVGLSQKRPALHVPKAKNVSRPQHVCPAPPQSARTVHTQLSRPCKLLEAHQQFQQGKISQVAQGLVRTGLTTKVYDHKQPVHRGWCILGSSMHVWVPSSSQTKP